MNKAEDLINKAIEEGKFDNLPGKGKPLNLEENPFEDPEWRMAHSIMRNAGFSLPWIESRREIESELEAARQALARAWAARQARAAGGRTGESIRADWQRAVSLFGKRLVEINQKIFKYNLEAPSDQLQIRLLKLEKEIERVTGQQGDE